MSLVDASDAGTFEVAAAAHRRAVRGAAGAHRDGGGDRRGLRRARRRRCPGRGAVVGDGGGPGRAVGRRAARHVPRTCAAQAAVVDAVRRCWASLWSARAIGYRAGRGIAPGDVSIAVVVQRLVPAEAAGVLFTIDPVSGALDQIVVSANWGLGESVVGRRRHPGRRGRRPGVGGAGQLPAGRQGGHDRGRRRGHDGDGDAGRPALDAGAFAGPGGRARPGRAVDREAVRRAGGRRVGARRRRVVGGPGAADHHVVRTSRPPLRFAANSGTTAWPGTTCGPTATWARRCLTS